MRLPDNFLQEMQSFFGSHKEIPEEGFFDSFDEPGYKGIRFSQSKTDTADREKILSDIGEIPDRVDWCSCGYYVPEEFSNRNPYYHAGVYYPQEPSAMLPAEVLAAKPGEVILDLCAAPGGKACRIGEDLGGRGLRVANEISFERSKALLRNIERSGIANSVILNENPDNIAASLPGFFDKILIDAPCSGEGMFRRDHQAVKSYEEYGPAKIVPVQKDILEAAHICLKAGGEIVYSTCTFCEDENEGQISAFISRHPEYEVIAHPEIKGVWHNGEDSALPGSMRILPHLAKGDGHFCVHIRKAGARNETDPGMPSKDKLKATERKGIELAKAFLGDLLGDDSEELTDIPLTIHGTGVFRIPFDEKLFGRLKIVKTGLYIGDIRISAGKTLFAASNSIALSLDTEKIRQDSYIGIPAGDERITRYLKGETISISDMTGIKSSGYVVIGVDKYPLGLGKISGSTIKNLYPKAWRMM